MPLVMCTATPVGAGDRPNQVRWQVLRDMLVAWLLTLPVSAALAAIACVAIRRLA